LYIERDPQPQKPSTLSDYERKARLAMKNGQIAKGALVTGVIGDDVHVTGIRIMEHALRDAGFKVVSLGIQVFQEDFLNAVIETKADAILVSSLSGHAKILVSGLKDKFIEVGLPSVLLYLGGQLVIGEMRWEQVEKAFKEMGFDRVYPPNTIPEQVIADLHADLKL
jgi:methylaspartate mutase sigma subunit